MNKQQIIEDRLQKAFNPTILEVINESHLHKGHTNYGDGNSHFAVKISSEEFKNLKKVEAHRKIYNELTDLMPQTIHALRIVII